jgi:hypothetical protein
MVDGVNLYILNNFCSNYCHYYAEESVRNESFESLKGIENLLSKIVFYVRNR